MTTTILTLLTLQALTHNLEAIHDHYVIRDGGADKEANRMWHVWDSAVWTCVHGMVALAAGEPALFFTGLTYRLYLMQVALNALRGLRIGYLGNNGMDGWFKRVLGERWSLALKAAAVMAVTLWAIVQATI